MKQFILALILAAPAVAQTAVGPVDTINFTISAPHAVILDIDAHWRGLVVSSCGTVASAIGSTDSTITLSLPVTAGTSIVLNGVEPIAVTSTGTTVTVQRGSSYFPLST